MAREFRFEGSEDLILTERLQARFWQSPFALCAATVITAQWGIIAFAAMSGRSVPFDVLIALTSLGSVMLAAGIWPNWNYLSLGREGLEQQAGLTELRVPWRAVKAVDGYDEGVELLFVDHHGPGPRVVRSTRIFNRYGMPPDAFAALVERCWQRGAVRATTG